MCTLVASGRWLQFYDIQTADGTPPIFNFRIPWETFNGFSHHTPSALFIIICKACESIFIPLDFTAFGLHLSTSRFDTQVYAHALVENEIAPMPILY